MAYCKRKVVHYGKTIKKKYKYHTHTHTHTTCMALHKKIMRENKNRVTKRWTDSCQIGSQPLQQRKQLSVIDSFMTTLRQGGIKEYIHVEAPHIWHITLDKNSWINGNTLLLRNAQASVLYQKSKQCREIRECPNSSK